MCSYIMLMQLSYFVSKGEGVIGGISEGGVAPRKDSEVVNQVLNKEFETVKFTATAKESQFERMRSNSCLYGKPRADRQFFPDDESLELALTESIRETFKSIGETNWEVQGVGRGGRRNYPSNGAVHSLEVALRTKDGALIYDGYLDRFCLSDYKGFEVFSGDLHICCDFERVLGRYSDARSLGAIYIEIGHALCVLINNFSCRSIRAKCIDVTGLHNSVSYFMSPLVSMSLER